MGALWVVSLKVPKTGIVRLQVWLICIEILASKSSDAYQGQASRETSGKRASKIRGVWDLGWGGLGADFLEQGQKC